jgi:hypothetical protein
MSVGCFGFGNQQASQLSRIADKHKIELDNLQREKKEEAAASAKEISGLRNRITALEAQLGNGKAGNTLSSAKEVRRGAENSADFANQVRGGVADRHPLGQNPRDVLVSAVKKYLEKQGDNFLKGVFDKFAERSTGTGDDYFLEPPDNGSISGSTLKFKALVKTDGLQAALLELGVHLKREKVEELMTLMDLDENGGLDFEEFKRAVQQQPPTELEQWAGMLPLAGMLARSLPVSGGPGDQPLRDFSRLGDDDLDTAVQVFSEGLKLLLSSARASSRQMFDSTDKKALEAAKDLADGVSAASKFKTFKMITGTVEDYHNGLTSRIGAPHPNFSKGMRHEHCVMYGFAVAFTTSNYGLTTTPRDEYGISTSKQQCPEKDMLDKKGRRVRVIRPIEELRRLKLCRKAGLTDDEILAVVRAQCDPVPIIQTHLI